ncbi:MAG TPA: WYL domain-containing protein [Acidimicrobiales bacterium]
MSRQLTAQERLRRMLAIVPWVAAQPDGATVEEICARFDLAPDQLQACLDTVFMVGVHPYTPDALVDVFVDHDRVQIRLPDFFTRPLRLTPAQAFALLAAGRSLQSVPGADPSGPLGRGLDKLADTVGARTTEVVDVDLGDTSGDALAMLQQAVAEGRRVEIEYYSYGRDTHGVRTVDPWRVQAQQGQWYLEAYAHDSDGVRVFRLDRIQGVRLLEETFERPESSSPLEVFRPRSSDPRVVLDLAPSAAWVVGQYPVESVEERRDGRIRVTLAIAARPWLERLLLRLGPDATVVDAPAELAEAGAEAARRLLLRYGE